MRMNNSQIKKFLDQLGENRNNANMKSNLYPEEKNYWEGQIDAYNEVIKDFTWILNGEVSE